MTDAKESAARAEHESWFGEPIQERDHPIENPENEARISEILRDENRYPSPIRPVGSRHSMTECISARGAARWGTLVDMTRLRTLHDDGSPLRVDRSTSPVTVTVPAGRAFHEVAHELKAEGLQFRVNTELGTLTMGAAACGATKDSSFPGESGQVCTDVAGMRIVRPDGEVKEFREGDRDLAALRCSYGLCGIVTEVTFRVYPLEYISIEHKKLAPTGESFASAELEAALRGWVGSGASERAVFLYLFPYRNRIVAELRAKPARGGDPEEDPVRLQVRNGFWEKGIHDWEDFTRGVQGRLPIEGLQSKLQDGFDKALAAYLDGFLRLRRVNPVAQIVDFDKESRASRRFTFSMWAFPEARFHAILPEYLRLREGHEATLRSCLPDVSYHIACDQSSLLSYSYDGPVWTLDPICPSDNAGPDWRGFLETFNDFCSERGGVPLLNQTPYLQRKHVERAFRSGGRDRLAEFEAARRRFDPANRMLNAYFARLLAP